MTEQTAEQVREKVGAVYLLESRRILATLIRLLGDFDLAEDALHEAFRAALQQWPKTGLPANPRAWLISAGRFKAPSAPPRQGWFTRAGVWTYRSSVPRIRRTDRKSADDGIRKRRTVRDALQHATPLKSSGIINSGSRCTQYRNCR